MRRKGHRKWWCDRPSLMGLLPLALVAQGCSFMGGGSAPPAPTAEHAPGYSGSGGSLVDFFSGSTAKSPQAVVGEPSDLNCPPVEVREGASTLTIAPPGSNMMSLKYQGSFVRTARECTVVSGVIAVKVGVQGRIVVGPAGGPGQVDVPVRFAVVQETPGGMKPIMTKLVHLPVVVNPGDPNVLFTHIETGLSFPIPSPTTLLDDYTLYIGFDPLAAQAQDQQSAPPRPKAKAKHKPANSG